MIIADTSVWINFLKGSADAKTLRLKELLGTRVLLLGDLIICEILQGIRDEGEAVRTQELLDGLPLASMVDRQLALSAARNYRILRRRGITIRKTIDLLIGTYCIEHDHRLLHNDRDFRPMVDHLGLVEA